jgi:hypothetical protein
VVVVVAAVAEQHAGSTARAAPAAEDRWDGVDQRDQLADVVAVAAGEADRQRQVGAVDD